MTMLKNWWAFLRGEVITLSDDETGDVPGWVLVTLMSAALVFAIWVLAGPALVELFERAINTVDDIGG